MRKLMIILGLIVIIAVVIAWRAPASLLLHPAQARVPDMHWSSVSGTAWNGTLEGFEYKGLQLGTLEWTFDGFEDMGSRLTRWKVRSHSPQHEMQARLTLTAAGEIREASNVQGRIPASWVDISEKETEVLVEVELPGVAEKDITILLSHNRVEIKGTKRRARFRKKVTYLRLEREYGPFRRFVSFPCAIIPEKSSAVLENGILLLVLKKYRVSRRKEVILEIGKSEE